MIASGKGFSTKTLSRARHNIMLDVKLCVRITQTKMLSSEGVGDPFRQYLILNNTDQRCMTCSLILSPVLMQVTGNLKPNWWAIFGHKVQDMPKQRAQTHDLQCTSDILPTASLNFLAISRCSLLEQQLAILNIVLQSYIC